MTRNWGGGDIWVAPPPTIISSPLQPKSFNHLQKERFALLVKTIANTIDGWQNNGKKELFAGIGIGTEVSLYQSLNPKEVKMRAYGYRAIQDLYCTDTTYKCGVDAGWSASELNVYRFQILNNYFTELGKIANLSGIPRERVYAHTWNEKNGSDGDPSFTNNLLAGLTPYSRPGQSLYKLSLDPWDFDLISQTIVNNGYTAWAAPEFAPLNKDDEKQWIQAFANTFDAPRPPQLINIYNEADIINTAAIPTLKTLLNKPKASARCELEIPIPIPAVVDPIELSWKSVGNTSGEPLSKVYLWENEPSLDATKAKYVLEPLGSNKSVELPKDIVRGQYAWSVVTSGCEGRFNISNPHFISIRTWRERNIKENWDYMVRRVKHYLN